MVPGGAASTGYTDYTRTSPAMKKATIVSLESSCSILDSARCFSSGTAYLSPRQRNSSMFSSSTASLISLVYRNLM